MRRLLPLGLLGVALALAAGLFDAEALWVPGLGLVVLALVLAGALTGAARGAEVGRELGAARVEEDEPLRVRVRARLGKVPLVPARLLAGDGEEEIARISAGRRTGEGERELSWSRRGRKALSPPVLELTDPLGLASRRISGAGDEGVLVLPRVGPVHVLAPGGALTGGENALAAALGAESELDGVRPYRPGTPATRIHWPAVARGAGLFEKRMLPEAERVPLVVVDPSRPDSAEALDDAVRAAASLAVALGRTGGCALLLPGDRRAATLEPGLAAWPHLHTRLALVEEGPAPLIGPHVHRHRAVLYVAARRPARPPAGLLQGPRGTRMLVVPGEWPGRTALLEVSGCRGYAVRAAERTRPTRAAA